MILLARQKHNGLIQTSDEFMFICNFLGIKLEGKQLDHPEYVNACQKYKYDCETLFKNISKHKVCAEQAKSRGYCGKDESKIEDRNPRYFEMETFKGNPNNKVYIVDNLRAAYDFNTFLYMNQVKRIIMLMEMSEFLRYNFDDYIGYISGGIDMQNKAFKPLDNAIYSVVDLRLEESYEFVLASSESNA